MMKRFYIELTEAAIEIYKGLQRYKRGEFVSAAIIEKHERDTGTDLAAEIAELRERVERLEGKGSEGK
jgi:hypothetical protein